MSNNSVNILSIKWRRRTCKIELTGHIIALHIIRFYAIYVNTFADSNIFSWCCMQTLWHSGYSHFMQEEICSGKFFSLYFFPSKTKKLFAIKQLLESDWRHTNTFKFNLSAQLNAWKCAIWRDFEHSSSTIFWCWWQPRLIWIEKLKNRTQFSMYFSCKWCEVCSKRGIMKHIDNPLKLLYIIAIRQPKHWNAAFKWRDNIFLITRTRMKNHQEYNAFLAFAINTHCSYKRLDSYKQFAGTEGN